jgi:hypothetical protein
MRSSSSEFAGHCRPRRSGTRYGHGNSGRQGPRPTTISIAWPYPVWRCASAVVRRQPVGETGLGECRVLEGTLTMVWISGPGKTWLHYHRRPE